MTPNRLTAVRRRIEATLDDLSDLFEPHVCVTFVARNPAVVDGDIVITNDDPLEVEAAIRRLRERQEPPR